MNLPNMFFIGREEIELDKPQEKEKLQLRIKNLLLLRNVNFLFGNGTSLPLNAPSISKIKPFIENLEKKFCDGNDSEKYAFTKIMKKMGTSFEKGIYLLKDFKQYYNTDIDFETMLSILIQISYTSEGITLNQAIHDTEAIISAIDIIKGFIFFSCRNFIENLPEEKLMTHKEFIRRVLLRSTTLPRVKFFTTNYDLVFEKCLDESGIFYFDGFVGAFEKRLRTESYNYDLYYPGETTEGNVNRVDRVLQLYKLHGSINWKRVLETTDNIFGIKQAYPTENEIGDLVIYPSTLKYGETLGFPYSEIFRLFSASLFKPQTVLFTFGYSFKDEHVNRIIYQALSIPTFNLVIVVPEGNTKDSEGEPINKEITRLIEKVGSKRILVVSGGQFIENELVGTGTFKGFVEEIMPDMEEMKIQEKINEEIEKLFPRCKNEKIKNTGEKSETKSEAIEAEANKLDTVSAKKYTGIFNTIKRKIVG